MLFEFFSSIIASFLLIVEKLGYFGIFIGMAIESSFFPLPSEAILIPAGVLISKGQMNFFLVLFASIFGSLLGASVNYFIAFFLGRKTVDFFLVKYGKLFFLTKNGLKKADDYFIKHGGITTFVGRLVFGIRHLISLPAGFSRMNFLKFSLFTCLGAGTWALVLILIGMFFGNNSIQPAMKIVAAAFLVLAVVITIFYFILKKKKIKT